MELTRDWPFPKLLGDAGDDTLVFGNEGQMPLADAGTGEAILGIGDGAIPGDLPDDSVVKVITLDGDDDIDARLMNSSLYSRLGNGNDSLLGSALDDQLWGNGGQDEISAGAGDDTVYGGSGDDIVFGGFGDDVIFGGGGQNELCGDEGDDRIIGGDTRDNILGGTGDDLITGNGGDDVIAGNDGNDAIDGGIGNDIIAGGNGDDTINGGDGNDVLTGSGGEDSIDGGLGDDVVSGGDGDDRLQGDIGDDIVAGGDGNDQIEGGFGDDTLDGGAGNDAYEGGLDDDTFVFGSENFGLVDGKVSIDCIVDFGMEGGPENPRFPGNDVIDLGDLGDATGIVVRPGADSTITELVIYEDKQDILEGGDPSLIIKVQSATEDTPEFVFRRDDGGFANPGVGNVIVGGSAVVVDANLDPTFGSF